MSVSGPAKSEDRLKSEQAGKLSRSCFPWKGRLELCPLLCCNGGDTSAGLTYSEIFKLFFSKATKRRIIRNEDIQAKKIKSDVHSNW